MDVAEKTRQNLAGKTRPRTEKDKPGIWHARVPMRGVIDNPNLTPAAKIVYASIAAYVYQGNTARIGQRRLAKVSCLNRSTVATAINQLLENKLIRVFNEGKSRRMYCLLSPLFGQKQGHEDVLVSSPSGGSRLASVRKTA